MELKSYADKTFGSKKDRIEQANADKMKHRGGWFGLTHLSLEKHFERFKPMLRSRSPFLAVERDINTCAKMREQARNINDERVRVEYGDIFDKLFSSCPSSAFNVICNGIPIYRVPLFRYGHLDFCCTAATLTEEGIEKQLRRLAKWWALKDTFYLEVVVAHRGDRNMVNADVLFKHFIPATFHQLRWELVDKSITDYKDTSMMRNAFFEFRREVSWKTRRDLGEKDHYNDGGV